MEDSHCLQNAIGEGIRIMKDGNPKINLLPLEPLRINELSIDQGGNSSVSIQLKILNCDMHGFSQIKVSDVESFSSERVDWRIKALVPRVELDGDFTSKGRILLFPITGKGKCNLTLVDLDITAALRSGEPVTKNNKQYYTIENVELKFQPKRMYLTFNNPDQDRLLEDQTNRFLNENWKDLFEELKPSFQDSFSALFKEIAARVFDRVPIKDMFLK
ncbi:protein takeout-like [Ctenocephalides felis]|uniref:protein takeout-like n=1 Tax=Ctenocephalides felis TaxID=7515 RepID=UPI000E6E37B4|nr:protein takeout-like [Ctenocephalides felis]